MISWCFRPAKPNIGFYFLPLESNRGYLLPFCCLRWYYGRNTIFKGTVSKKKIHLCPNAAYQCGRLPCISHFLSEIWLKSHFWVSFDNQFWAVLRKYSLYCQELSYSSIGLPAWFFYQNIEDVVLTEVPKLMVDASDLVLTPIWPLGKTLTINWVCQERAQVWLKTCKTDFGWSECYICGNASCILAP